MNGRSSAGRVLLLLALLGLAGAVAFVLLAALSGSVDLPQEGEATLFAVLLALTLLAGVAGGLLVQRELSHKDELEARLREQDETARRAQEAEEERRRERDEAREEEGRRQEEIERTREEVREREQRIAEERKVRGHLVRAREAEKEYSRQLRTEIVKLNRERGALADVGSDVPTLVLRLSMTLLEADKGMLLRRVSDPRATGSAEVALRPEDDPAAGERDPLELAAALGFQGDPRRSDLAQRFGTEVMAKDTTVRDDSPQEGGEGDDEIENLVAIPIYLADEFGGVVVCANRDGGFEEYDDELLISIGDHAGAVLDNHRMRGELRGSYLATVALLAEALEAKDPFLRGHSDEVAGYVSTVAEQLGVEPQRQEELVFASLLHDVGKIGISERILLKPTKLSPEEFSIVKLHPRIGCRLIEQVPALQSMAPAILHHHERWDGDGYPAGLSGEQIPLEARIICVADSFSAMTAERPYRSRISLQEACAELERCAGTQFDPQVVKVFVEAVRTTRPETSGQAKLHSALDDPELQVRREGDEPLLGFGAFAVTDSLTLLYSHTYFHEVAQAEAARAEIQERPFAVVLADVSNIRELNTGDGFPAGDGAIRTVARAVHRAAVRCGGTACRHGGARLGLLAPETDLGGAERIARELAADLEDEPGIRLRTAWTVWTAGEPGDDVIDRARTALAGATPVARAAEAESA